jgi:chorismate-pyruvate lyase
MPNLSPRRNFPLFAAGLLGALTFKIVPAEAEDLYTRRLEWLALIETLDADLLASRSATLTLENWCAEHRMAAEARIRAERFAGAAKEASAETRQRLAVGGDTPLKYRRVTLFCGTHALSEADNWYVPERLTEEMNAVLVSTDEPFGRVVRPLEPRRQTISATRLWQPLPKGWEMAPPRIDESIEKSAIPEFILEHRAVLVRSDGMPFAEVVENYRRDLFDFSAAR